MSVRLCERALCAVLAANMNEPNRSICHFSTSTQNTTQHNTNHQIMPTIRHVHGIEEMNKCSVCVRAHNRIYNFSLVLCACVVFAIHNMVERVAADAQRRSHNLIITLIWSRMLYEFMNLKQAVRAYMRPKGFMDHQDRSRIYKIWLPSSFMQQQQ